MRVSGVCWLVAADVAVTVAALVAGSISQWAQFASHCVNYDLQPLKLPFSVAICRGSSGSRQQPGAGSGSLAGAASSQRRGGGQR